MPPPPTERLEELSRTQVAPRRQWGRARPPRAPARASQAPHSSPHWAGPTSRAPGWQLPRGFLGRWAWRPRPASALPPLPPHSPPSSVLRPRWGRRMSLEAGRPGGRGGSSGLLRASPVRTIGPRRRDREDLLPGHPCGGGVPKCRECREAVGTRGAALWQLGWQPGATWTRGRQPRGGRPEWPGCRTGLRTPGPRVPTPAEG